MNLGNLPRPYRMLAEYRREEGGGGDGLCGAFTWIETPEGYDFWQAVNNGNFPEIPAASIRELLEAGKLKPGDVLEYVQQMFRASPLLFSDNQVKRVIELVKCWQGEPQPPATDLGPQTALQWYRQQLMALFSTNESETQHLREPEIFAMALEKEKKQTRPSTISDEILANLSKSMEQIQQLLKEIEQIKKRV